MSELLSSEELERLQADMETYTMPDTCAILSPTNASDGQGGNTVTWGTATASVACRLDGKVEGKEYVAGAAVRAYSRWILTLPYDATIQESWRVVHDSNTYNVIGKPKGGSWKAHVRCELELV
jgi:head-tail adaptor